MNTKQAFLTLLVSGGILAGANIIGDRLDSSPTNQTSNRPALIQPVYGEEELTLEQITKEVEEKKVEEIIDLSQIEHLNDANLEGKAFNSGKKGFIFVYDWEDSIEYRRAGIIFREIQKKYGDLNFFGYKNKGDFTKQNYINRRTGITALPSILMLSDYDILTGKKYAKNIVLDIIRGGPSKDKTVMTMIKELPEYWINSNLFGKPPSDKKIYRFNNTFKYQEVGVFN